LRLKLVLQRIGDELIGPQTGRRTDRQNLNTDISGFIGHLIRASDKTEFSAIFISLFI